MLNIDDFLDFNREEVSGIIRVLLSQCVNQVQVVKTLHYIGVAFIGFNSEDELIRRFRNATTRDQWAIICTAMESEANIHSVMDVVVAQSALEFAAIEYLKLQDQNDSLIYYKLRRGNFISKSLAKNFPDGLKDALDNLVSSGFDEWLCPTCCSDFIS